MKKIAILMTAAAALPLSACATNPLKPPKTAGEINTGYNYIPVDPLEVSVLVDERYVDSRGRFPLGTAATEMRQKRYERCVARGDDDKKADVMDALPDHTVRMAVRETSATGNGGFGPLAVSAEGRTYQMVVDSMFADTTNIRFAIRVGPEGAPWPLMSLPEKIPAGTPISVTRLMKEEAAPRGYEEVALPVYVGIGLRLTANVYSRKGGLKLSSLPALAASAEAQRTTGSLIIQTLGIYNQQVAAVYPIQSELNATAVQNALVSLGSVKAIVYDRDTGTRPRVTGLYNPLPTSDPKLINRIYSALTSEPINWAPCGSS